MWQNISLNLLILCGTLSQSIAETFLENNHIAENSSSIHIRKKRVIDESVSRYRKWNITDVPYIVKVLRNGVKMCAGIIVSPEHVLATKICIDTPTAHYTVESGELSMNIFQIHTVERIIFKEYLALLLLNPFILLERPSLNRKIKLYEDVAAPRTIATISGWYLVKKRSRDGIQTQNSLRRSVYVPIISRRKCTSYYKDHDYEITSDNICTLDPLGKKGCTHEDGGSALVLSEELVGVLIFSGSIVGQCRPDVFIRVNNNNTYNQWIKSNIAPHLNDRVRSSHLPNILPQTAHK